MRQLQERLDREIGHAKDALLDAGHLLQRLNVLGGTSVFPQVDRLLGRAHDTLSRALKMALVLRTPLVAEFDLQQLFQTQAGHLTKDIRSSFLAADPRKEPVTCTGDSEQIICCLQILIQNIPLSPRGSIQMQLYTNAARPRIEAHYDGLRAYPEELNWEGMALCTRAELEACWQRATCGGQPVFNANPMVYPLSGDADGAPPCTSTLGPTHTDAMSQLVKRLRPWRGTIGVWEPGFASLEESAKQYLETVAYCMRGLNDVLGMETPSA